MKINILLLRINDKIFLEMKADTLTLHCFSYAIVLASQFTEFKFNT